MTLIEDIEFSCNDNAERTAIVLRDGKNNKCLSYKEVRSIAEKLCKDLLRIGIVEHSCVGLFMDHNIFIPSLVICLQILKCPFTFLSTIKDIEKTKVKWILSFECFLENQDAIHYGTIRLDSIQKINANNNINLHIWTKKCDNRLYDNICYIIHTSGTTGENKEVRVEHFCIESNINCLKTIFNITKDDLIYYGTPLTFDPSMIELFLSLVSGACLLITPDKTKLNRTSLLKHLFPENDESKLDKSKFDKSVDDKHVTFIQIVPSLFLKWSSEEFDFIFSKTRLRLLVLGGEPFPRNILSFKKRQELQIYNIYGITEVSCWASILQIKDDIEEITLGCALDDTILEVRKDNLKINEGIGELYIGSPSRKCYVNDEEESRLIRKTGDLVHLKNGEIIYLGRSDNSVKRFGHLIHTQEIEEIISRETNLRNVVLWMEKARKLVIFFTVEGADPARKEKIIDKLRVRLMHSLPKQYFPDQILLIPVIPLTKNGKVDRKALEDFYLKSHTNSEDLEPLEVFCYLWKQYLGVQRDESLNFFECGGNSILAIQFLGELRSALNFDFSGHFLMDGFGICCDYIKRNVIKQENQRVRKNQKKKNVACKRPHTSSHINYKLSWKYNMRACVDTDATIFEYKGETLLAIGSFANIFSVLNLETGWEISKVVLPDSIESAARIISIEQDKICVGCKNGTMYCINFTTGDIIWEYETGNAIKNQPVLYNDCIIFGSYDKYVHCVNISKGELKWKTPIKESITSNPILLNGRIHIATIQGTIFSIQEKGEIIWLAKTPSPIFGSPCLLNNEESIVWPNVKGDLICLNSNGKTKWKYSTNEMIFSSLFPKGQNEVLFSTKNNHVYCVVCTQGTCTLKFRIILDGPMTASPTLLRINQEEFIVAVTNKGGIYLIDQETLETVVVVQLDGEVFSSPQVQGSKLVIGCRDDNVHCIEFAEVGSKN